MRIESDLKLLNDEPTGSRAATNYLQVGKLLPSGCGLETGKEENELRPQWNRKYVRDTCDKLIRNESRGWKRKEEKKTFFQTIRFPFEKQVRIIRSVPSPFVTLLINVEYATVSRPSTSIDIAQVFIRNNYPQRKRRNNSILPTINNIVVTAKIFASLIAKNVYTHILYVLL